MNLPFVLDPTRVALALGISAAVVTVLYLLRERYRPVLVSHLPLWEESVKRSTPLALAKKLRKLLSLLLQMIIIAAVVMAMTDPGWGEKPDPRDLILLMDVSTSMRSDDGEPEGTRMDQARRFATALVQSLSDDDRVLLVSMSSSPVVSRSWGGPGKGLEEAIGKVEPLDARADISVALDFASAALADRAGGEIWILSDGAFGLSEQRAEQLAAQIETLEKRDVTLRHHRCGREADNAAITHFAMRQDLRDRIRVDGMLEIARFAPSGDDSRIPVKIEVTSGGHPVLSRTVKLGTESERIWLDLLSPPSREIEATLTPKQPDRDHLVADNAALVTLPEETELDVLAVSVGNTFLQAALLLSPTWNVEWVAPGDSTLLESYDVVILDGPVAMPHVEATGILSMAPGPDSTLVQTDGIIEVPTFESFDREHPIIRWTNLYNVNITEAASLVTEKKDRILASSLEGPMIMLREPEEGPRVMVMAFSLAQSDLPLRAAWPLLFLNTIHHLGGESLDVVASSVSPQESAIAPKWLADTTHMGKPPKPTPRRPPLWLLLVACAALLFALEWFSYHKRITV